MSEKLPAGGEHALNSGNTGEYRLPEHGTPEVDVDKHNQNAAETAQEARRTLESLQSSETPPQPFRRLEAEEKASQPMAPGQITGQMKKLTQRRMQKDIQRQLPPVQRALSRMIHQPAVRLISEGASKTISRPSGLLGGGVVALLGTTIYSYLAHHVGFRANYLVFIILFFGGFALGVLLELVVWLLGSRRRHS